MIKQGLKGEVNTWSTEHISSIELYPLDNLIIMIIETPVNSDFAIFEDFICHSYGLSIFVLFCYSLSVISVNEYAY